MISAKGTQEHYKTFFSNGTNFEGFADTTAEHGGSGSGIRPKELLEAALACCMNMVVRIKAEKLGIKLDNVEVKVNLNRENIDASVFEYKIIMDKGIPEESRKRILAAVEGCPVKKTLAGDISFMENPGL